MPAERVGEPATERWTDQAGEAEDGAEESLIATALLRAVEVANGGERNREERTSAEPLNAAENDQLLNVL